MHAMKRLLALLALVALVAPARADEARRAALRDEAYQAAQRAMNSAAAAALSQLGARFSAGESDLAKAVRARQDLAQAASRLDREVTLARATPGDDQAARVAKLRAEGEATRARLAQADAGLRQRFPDYAELSAPQPLSIADTQALLDADEALALIFVARDETFVWALTRDRADWTRVERARAGFVEDVKRLRAALDPQAFALMPAALEIDSSISREPVASAPLAPSRSTDGDRSRPVSGAITRSFAEASVEGDAPAPEAARPAFERARAAALYDALLRPFEALIAAKPRLYAVVSAPFDSLPLSLLVAAPPQGSDLSPDDLRATQWLIRRQAVVALPSPGSLRALRGARPAREEAPAEPFRGYGAPLLGQSFDTGPSDAAPAPIPETLTVASGAVASLYRGGVVDRQAVSRLPALPQTEGELKALAQALGAGPDALRLGAKATASAVRADDLSRFRVLAFATHGLLAGELKGLQEPALVFTPSAEDEGLLTASQAARLDLNADWVVLSACNTAGGDGEPGAQGFSGLARAFFYAGAKSLLVSHWPVRDDAAARVTTGLFQRLRETPGLAKAEAHRRSVLALIDDGRDPTLAHPAVWAPFVVAGEGR
jgi:CHAT domain-containing protein